MLAMSTTSAHWLAQLEIVMLLVPENLKVDMISRKRPCAPTSTRELGDVVADMLMLICAGKEQGKTIGSFREEF